MFLRMSHVPGFYTLNSDLWENHLHNFVPVSNLSTYLYQIRERPNSGCKGKTCCGSGHLMSSNVMLTILNLICLMF